MQLQRGQERVAKSRLGSYYAKRADGGRTLFAKGEEKRAELADLKVGHGVPFGPPEPTPSECLACISFVQAAWTESQIAKTRLQH